MFCYFSSGNDRATHLALVGRNRITVVLLLCVVIKHLLTEGAAADAFCDAVIAAARSGTGLPSLTDLEVEVTSDGRSGFAKLLAATPTFSRFFVRLSEVRDSGMCECQ